MRPTLINHEQVDIAERVVAGLDEEEVLTHRVVPLGHQLTTTHYWSPGYAVEAFVTVVEALLLAAEVRLVAPAWDGATVLPAYASLVPGTSEFVRAAAYDTAADTGALDPAVLDALDDGHDGTGVTYVRAYNGRYGDVAVRLGPSDLAHVEDRVNQASADERFEDGELTSAAIARACERIEADYGVRAGERFRNRTGVALPPLVPMLLERLPGRPAPDAFVGALLELRAEVEPLRGRFEALVAIADDPARPVAEAEELIAGFSGESGAVVQFCVDPLSFLAKLVAKQGADPVAAVPAELQSRLRSNAPAVLSAQRVADVAPLLERRFGLALDGPDL